MLAVFSSTLFAATIPVEVILAAGGVVLVGLAAGGIGLWRLFGAGPRRNRAYQRARQSLAQGEWETARAAIDEIKLLGIATPEWQGRINNLEGECRRAAGEKAAAERKFEEALEHHLAAAKLLNTSPTEARDRVLDGMLSELRSRVAGNPDERAAKLAQRVLQLQPQHAEASFWLGLLHIKLNRSEQAQAALRAAIESEKSSVEPALYLGMLLIREGKAKDGLRYLAEANKNAPNSVLVSWQLGMGLVVSGGDSALAVRALQKAVGPEGLPKLARSPDRFWLDALPEGSYLGKLAGKQQFVCPILGNNITGMVRQAKLALGQALFRLERTVESVAVLQELLNESEPTVPVLRALGIALCKLERFDDAYANLRAAYEQDSTKSPLTACYLAWSATRAKPSKPEDRPANVRWAVRLLADAAIPVEVEPARLACHVYADARSLEIPAQVEDLLRLCGTLLAVNLVEPAAAEVLDQLAMTSPHSVRPQHAFLYSWIAKQHGVRGQKDTDLLLLTMQHEGLAQEYFTQRGWNLAEVERLYLERWVEHHTGFPEALGPNYPAHCEKELLEQAKKQEEAGDVQAARATIDLLRRLTPPTAATYDRTARLAYARGDIDEAARLLSEWCAELPNEPTPRIRLAVIEHGRGRHESAREHLHRALELTSGPAAAAVALLAARLSLRADQPREALEFVERSLELQPGNGEALWLKAALSWRVGAVATMPLLAPSLERSDIGDPRFHYMAAICFLLAGDVDAARTAARRVSSEIDWQADGHHLMGVLHWRRSDYPGAASRLEAVLQTPDHIAAEHAKLLLGRVRWEQGSTVEALELWQQLTPPARVECELEPQMPAATFLAGAHALREGNAAAAAELLGRARELGYRDRHLPLLHERALVQAARDTLSADDTAKVETLVPLLERSSKSHGPQQALAALLLARLHRRKGNLPQARDALRRVSPPNSPVLLQTAAAALEDKQLGQAEETLGRVLYAEPANFAARFNLFWTRFSLGNVRGAAELLPELIETAAAPEQKRLLMQLNTLLQGGTTLNIAFGDMTVEEERRLLDALFRVGKLEAVVPLLCQFAAARPQSREAKEAQTLAMLRLGKQCFDRGDWLGAERWLSPLAKARPSAAVRNLLGLNACLTQDFAGGILHLQEAQRLAGDDPRLHQNLALAFALQGDFDEAGLCWGRYLGMMDKRLPRPPGYFDYHDHLRFQVLRYLGNQQYDRERWAESLAYLEEAHALRPDLADLAERVFLLQVQIGKRGDARRTLNSMHQLKPKHGPYQLYELDLVEVRASADLEKLLDALSRVVEQMLDDPSVQDKAVQRVLPTLQHRSDYLTRVMREIREDLRRLYEDSPGWYDALRDLRSVKRDLRRLRQVVRYCAALQVVEGTRRRLDSITDELDRKIEYCRRWEEDDQ